MMSAATAGELEIQQQRLDNRKKNLLDTYFPFRGGFYQGINRFAEEAAKTGLRGVAPTAPKTSRREGVMEVTFALRESDFVAVSSSTARHLAYDGPLASKIFVYLDKQPDRLPVFELVVSEQGGQEGYLYEIYFGDDRIKIQTREITDPGQDGEAAARRMIDCFYSTQAYWEPPSTLGEILGGDSYPELGYQVPEDISEQ
jgi:hypothetical protein